MRAYLSETNNSWLPRHTSKRTNGLNPRLKAPCTRGFVGNQAPSKHQKLNLKWCLFKGFLAYALLPGNLGDSKNPHLGRDRVLCVH